MLTPSMIPRLKPNTQLYKYRLRRCIGCGSFGVVWLASDQAVDHEYAIKILRAGANINENLREAQVGHQLKHPNVVRIHQADVTSVDQQQLVLLAMDYVAAGPITKLANPSGYLPLPEVIRLGRDILSGLGHLHNKGLIHNDIKPENVLIGDQGAGMLTDYGIVGITEEGGPIPASAFYKIHAAPETIASSSTSAQSDVYQVGLTLFRLLVGIDALRQKFNQLGEQGYYQVAAKSELIRSADFPSYVPSRLRRLVRKAAHPDLSKRFSSAIEMRRELEKLRYRGYWTVNNNGEFLGHNDPYTYRYEQKKTATGQYDVTALRKNPSKERETRCSKYCHKSLSKADARKEIDKFVRAVVETF